MGSEHAVTSDELGQISDPTQRLAATIQFRGQLDLASVATSTPSQLVQRLKNFEQTNAVEASRYLAQFSSSEVSEIRHLWITNALWLQATPKRLIGLLNLPSVQSISISHSANEPETSLHSNEAFSGEAETGKTVSSSSADGMPAWGIQKVGAPQAWKRGFQGQGVLVALIDSGVNYRHPDLRPNIWKNPGEWGNDAHGNLKMNNQIDDDRNGYIDDIMGWNFETDSNQIVDYLGHGSATAGIIAGNGTAGRPTGVAPQSRLMALQIGAGRGPQIMQLQIWEAIQYALVNHAQVISMSLTLSQANRTDALLWHRIGQILLAAGIVHVNSAGNSGEQSSGQLSIPASNPSPWYPAMEPNLAEYSHRTATLTVGATDREDQVRPYSSFGPVFWSVLSPESVTKLATGQSSQTFTKPDLCAPSGVPTIAVSGNGYTASFGGTSAAAPHVAGAVALLLSARARLTPSQIAEALVSSSLPMPARTGHRCGAGRMDIIAALDYVTKFF